MTTPGHLGVEGKGQAPHFRLTEEDHAGQPPTRDFLRWDGTKYRRLKKQNPGSESGATPAPKAVPPLDAKAGPPPLKGGSESGAILMNGAGSESGAITSLTTPVSRDWLKVSCGE
jgi:hypothetical protein